MVQHTSGDGQFFKFGSLGTNVPIALQCISRGLIEKIVSYIDIY